MKVRVIFIYMLVLYLGVQTMVKNAAAKSRKMLMSEYVDKMKAGWIGQMAGVGWGAPTEFKFKGKIIPMDKMPKWDPKKINQFRQDDIYVEMTFLQTLEDHGFDVTIRQAGIDFACSGYNLWHANKAGRNNLRKGIAPPDSSHPRFNKCADDIDYQIESDYSGLIAPGMPQLSIELGEKFGRLMNYGDGMYAGQFIGAMYAEAFFESNPVKIIKVALKSIPQESQYAEMVRDMLKWYDDEPDDWQKVWLKVEKKYHENPAYTHLKCSHPGAVNKFSINAKLNGSYILMGLLYGKGDLDQTIIISTRCGQDSDCNPANAGGILFTTIGLNNLPKRFTSKLDTKGKFSHTRYDFPGLVEVSKKLVRQAVVRSGGKINLTASGEEELVIPVKNVKPSELIHVKNPGPIVNSKFTEEEIALIKDQVFKNHPKADISESVKKFAPGWTIANCGKDMKPGLRPKWGGREKVLVTHPLSREVPCVLSRNVKVPVNMTTELILCVAHNPRGDWTIVIKVDEKQISKKKISKHTCQDGWRTITIDLSEYSGKSIKLSLENQADGWRCEAGYWDEITIESK